MTVASAKLGSDHVVIRSGGKQFRVVQRDQAGEGAGCPMQLVVGALSACILLTLKAVAAHKGIELAEPEVGVVYNPGSGGGSRFEVDVRLNGTLTERERKILFQSARICEVGKMLKGNVDIEYRMAIKG